MADRDNRTSVTLHELKGAGPKQTAIVERARALIETAVNHAGFRRRLSEAQYRRTRFETARGRRITVPPAEVINYVLEAAESGTDIDFDIDLRIHLVPKDEGVLGSTWLRHQPINTGYWWINKCIARNDAISLAHHFMHEWLHVVGFYHSPNNKARHDVPYTVGYIVAAVLNHDVRGLVEKQDPELAGDLEKCACGASDRDQAATASADADRLRQ